MRHMDMDAGRVATGGNTSAKDALRESEARYRRIFQTAAVSIWEQDFSAVKRMLDDLAARGVGDFRSYFEEHPELVREALRMVTTRDVNETSLRMFGARSKDEFVASLARILTPEAEAVFAEMLIAIAEGRPSFEADAVLRTLQGERRDVLLGIALPRSDESFDRLLVTMMDITERQIVDRIGKALVGELDFERAVQAVTDAATEVSGAKFGAFFYNVTDRNGESYLLYTLSGAPREAFERFGTPRNTAVFKPTFEGTAVVRSDDITKDPRYGHNAPHYGMPKGHLPVRSYLAVPVVSRTGEVIGGLFFGHPETGVFTERAERLVTGIAAQAAVAIDNARLYDERQKLIDELRQSDRRKDEFLATLSHELRNPLAPIRSAVALLQRAEGDAAVRRMATEILERQLDHLVRLVDDLLDIARITRDSLQIRHAHVELGAIVRSAVEASEPLIKAARHRLSVEVPPEPLVVDGDGVRLTQIVANLLNNAAKYTDEGGEIRLTLQARDGWAAISVADSGDGIAPEVMPRIFDRFGSARRGHHKSGLGIGLALAQRLAELHGGRIEARSAGVGQGAEFIVYLPLVAPTPSAAPLTGER